MIHFLNAFPLSVGKWFLPFDLVNLKAEAKKRTGGLTDFGDLDWEMLNKLMEPCNKACHIIGRIGMREWATNIMVVHLRLSQILRDHPEVQDEVIDRPIVIAGYARSSSTFLLHILAQTYGESVRYPHFWETIGGLEADAGRPGSMVKEAERAMINMRMFPSLASMHEVDSVWQPEEDIGWMMFSLNGWYLTFASNEPWMQFAVHESSRAKLRYSFLKRFLQIKQWQDGKPRRWILKSPEHLHNIKELTTTFPDLRLVTLHRDEVPTYKSLLLLYHVTWGMNFETMNARHAELLKVAVDVTQCRQQAGLREANALGANMSLPLTFKDVTGKPHETLARVAAFTGLPWNAAVQSIAERAVEASRAKKRQMGQIRYAIEEFGLTDASIMERLSHCDRFKDYETWAAAVESANLCQATDTPAYPVANPI
jgi:hypothetical protein